jgi:predicted ATPase
MATKGWAAPEAGQVYDRARALCQQMGETPQLFPVLCGLSAFYQVRGELPTQRELGEQLLSLAQSVQDSALLLQAHLWLGSALLHMGEPVASREHLEQGIALYNLQRHRSHALLSGGDPEVTPRSLVAVDLWVLGYPDQALKRTHEALALAQELSRPFGLCFALVWAALLHLCRGEGQLAQERAEAAMALASEQEFSLLLAAGTIDRGSALAEQGQEEEGIAQLRQGLDAYQATGAEVVRPRFLAILAEADGKVGHVEEGFQVLAEATAVMRKTKQHHWEAELYRLKGELTLKQLGVRSSEFGVTNPQPLIPDAQVEAEACFLRALEVARKQQAKSLELRAAMSLARLWQSQGKKDEARQLLAEVYNWFTEGFDTKDLQEAKVLLEELS